MNVTLQVVNDSQTQALVRCDVLQTGGSKECNTAIGKVIVRHRPQLVICDVLQIGDSDEFNWNR